MTETLTQQHLDDAKAWYEYNDIRVTYCNFQCNIIGRLAIITDDENEFQLELSEEEIMYRAELWNEMEENLEGENI